MCSSKNSFKKPWPCLKAGLTELYDASFMFVSHRRTSSASDYSQYYVRNMAS